MSDEFCGTDRFEVLELIDDSGRLGSVYRVYDREWKREVALKWIRDFNPEFILQLKDEFRLVKGISHPNLVSLYELFFGDGYCYFTMELIQGENFTNYIWRQGGHPFADAGLSGPGLSALRRALQQLAEGVEALHRNNRLHCDIKPENVLVTAQGRVVLLDFDLGMRLRLEGIAQLNGIAGTRFYMSPEQIFSEPLDWPTDWYSVGALLFETLTGELLLNGSFHDIYMKIGSLVVPQLNNIAPGTPEDLNLLVHALLQRDTSERAGLPAILRVTCGHGLPTMQTPYDTTRARAHGLFVGRSEELARLRDIFDAAPHDGPTLVCIEGQSGIGKTALVRHFLTSVSALILEGGCDFQESVPYKVFDQIIDQLSTHLSMREPGDLAGLSPEQESALLRLFPVLGSVASILGAADHASSIASNEMRQLAFDALRELLSKLAKARRLILWVDDVHWGDPDSALLMRELLRSPNAPRLMLVMSYRDEESGSNVFLRSLSSFTETRAPWIHKIRLDPLSEDDCRALAAATLASTPGAPLIKDLVVGAEGSPYLLLEFARNIVDGLGGVAVEGSIDARIKALLNQRLSLLGSDEQRLLEVVAIAGKQTERGVVLRAAEVGESEQHRIRWLSDENFVRVSDLDQGRAIGVYHDRLRQVILSSLDSARKTQLHRRLAEALEVSDAADPDDLFVHYKHAGDDTKARRYALRSAERAMETLAFARAAERYGWLLERAEHDVPRWELHRRFGEALANAGDARAAGEAFKHAAEERERSPHRFANESREEALDLRRKAAEQYLRGGHVDEGRGAVTQVLRAVGLEYPASPIGAWLSMLAWRTVLNVRGLGYEVRSEEQITRRELDRIDACWSAGLGLGWIDRTRTAAFQARGALLALRAGERSRVALTLVAEASQLASFGGAARRRRSEEVLEEAKQLVDKSDDPMLSAFFVLMEGSMAFYAADWRNALTLCQRALKMLRSRERGVGWEVTTAHLLSLGAMTYLGELGELQRELPRLVEEAEMRGDLISAASLASGLPNVLWLALDQPEEASRRAEGAIQRWHQDDFQFPHYLHLIASTQIDLYRGDGRAAWRRLAKAVRRLGASFLWIVENLRITLVHLYARAAIAAAVELRDARGLGFPGEREALLRVAARCAARLEREEAAWAAPMAFALRAGLAAARGEDAAALAALERAASLFDAREMALYAAAVRFQRGVVSKGSADIAAQREGEAWMRGHAVVKPSRLAAMLVPGCRD